MTWTSFWVDFGPLIQTVAFVVSAVAAVAVIYHNGKLAKKRALIDLIIQQRTDEQLNAAIKIVYGLANNDKNQLSLYVSPEGNDEHQSIRAAILKVLNNQEFVAVGIRLGAFDEKVYKELQCSNVLKIWRATSGFVFELRKQTGHDTIFQDLEKLADRWSKAPIKRI